MKPEVAGLLGCGVMAGLGAAMLTGEVGAGRLGRRVRLRGSGRRRHRGRSRSPGASTIIAVDLDARKLELAKEFGATHTVDASATDPVAAIQAAHRRQRRRRVHRGGRPPEGVRAGVLRPRPRRHRRAGRRPQPRDAHRAPDDRLLRAGRAAQAELVRRLPAEPGLPDARRPAPAGAAAAGEVRVARRSASTPWRRPSTRWSAARCCARSCCSDADRARGHVGDVQPRRAGLRRRQQRVARG